MGAKKLTYYNKNHYYPFGMLLPNRHEEAGEYRYGFQGQEKDDEIKGEGNSVNYKYRMHDPRIGRFFAVDPLTSKYPHYTPYSFSGNKVIHAIELEGLEEVELNSGEKVFTGPVTEKESIAIAERAGAFENGNYITKYANGSKGLPVVDIVYNKSGASSSVVSGGNNSSSNTENSNSFPSGSLISTTAGLTGSYISGSSIRLFRQNGSIFSPRLYNTGWTGGSVSKIKTYNLTKIGTGLKVGGGALSIFGIINTEIQYGLGNITEYERGKQQVLNGIGLAGGYGAAFSLTYSGMGWLQDATNTYIAIPWQYNTDGSINWSSSFGKWGTTINRPKATLLDGGRVEIPEFE